MRQKVLFLILALCLIILPVNGQSDKPAFRVVGYYSLRSAMNGFPKFPFNKVTHVNLYFLNPDSLGNFTQDFSALIPFITST